MTLAEAELHVATLLLFNNSVRRSVSNFTEQSSIVWVALKALGGSADKILENGFISGLSM